MKKEISSYSSSIHFKDNFLPSWAGFAFELILASLLLIGLNARAIWSYFSTGFAPDYTVDLGSVINQYTPWIYEPFDFITHGRVAQAIFWLFIGCIAYIGIWLVGNILTNIRNDIVADTYVHPKSYSKAGYWSNILSRKVFFVCLLVVFVVYIYAFSKLSQTLANLAFQAVADFQLWHSLFILFDSLLTMAILIHILYLLFRIVRNTWRYIYKDL